MKKSVPEQEGVDSGRLADFVERFFALRWTHSLVVARHGRIVAECYRDLCSPSDRHQLFSLSKSFTSTAVGIALGEGLIPSLDASAVSFFPEFDSPHVSERMRRVTLRHLLSMGMGRASCGFWGDRYIAAHDRFVSSADAADMRKVSALFASNGEIMDPGVSWVRTLLEDELRDEPGSRFEYNSAATFLLSAVVQKVSGVRLGEYLRPRFFRPLGIAESAAWDSTPDGIDFGGVGLNLTVREISAAAECWLRGGVAPDGRRLVPASYMAEATSKQIDNSAPGRNPDWCQGYGYQFWRCRHGAFRGDGAAGQLAVMFPEFDATVAATAGMSNMQSELDTIYDALLPAFSAAPLPPNPEGLRRLRDAENGQKFDLGPEGAPNAAFFPDATPGLDGDALRMRFTCSPNPVGMVQVAFEQDVGGVSLEFTFGDGVSDELRAGYHGVRSSCLRRVSPCRSFTAFARASWPAQKALRIVAALPETTSFFTFDMDFSAMTLRLTTPIWFAHSWLGDVAINLIRA